MEQEAENPDGGIFIPRCTVDGKWQRAQCHKSTGYCWCVNENTGHPIGGTSTHGVAPECNFEAERDIQGIIANSKIVFLITITIPYTDVQSYSVPSRALLLTLKILINLRLFMLKFETSFSYKLLNVSH